VSDQITTREEVLQALVRMLKAQAFFPDTIAVDAPEVEDWRPLSGLNVGMSDGISVQDGPVTVTRQGCGRGDIWELQVEAAVAYAVQGLDPTLRRLRGDEAVRMIAAAIDTDPTLGLGVQVYAEVDPAERDDDVPMSGAVAAATRIVPVRVLYTAANAAG